CVEVSDRYGQVSFETLCHQRSMTCRRITLDTEENDSYRVGELTCEIRAVEGGKARFLIRFGELRAQHGPVALAGFGLAVHLILSLSDLVGWRQLEQMDISDRTLRKRRLQPVRIH